MALKNILVGFHFLNHGSKCCVNLYACRFAIFQIADRNIVLSRLNIKQVIDGDAEVVSSDISIAYGYNYVLLFLSSINL